MPLVAVAPRPRRGRVLRPPARRAASRRAPWGDALGRPQRTRGTRRDRASRSSARCGRPLFAWCSACRSRTCSRARASRAGRSCARWSCCRWCCHRSSAASRCCYAFQRNDGLVGGWLYDLFGLPVHVHQVGCRPGRDVRRHAVPRDHGRGRAAHDGPALRGRRGQPRRRTVDGVPARDAADDRARAVSPAPRSAWARALGEFGATITFAGQHPGPHADDAARGLPPARVATRPSRSRSAWCCSPSRSSCSSRCATTGSEGCVTLDAERRASSSGRSTSTSRSTRPTGETVAVLGPNGAGKSTLLRALAGLLPIDAGRIAIDGVTWSTTRRRHVTSSPSGARVGVVFQDYLLFPHLSVLRERRVRSAQSRARRGRGARRACRRVARARRSRRPRRRQAARSSRAGSSSASRWRARS